jgi:UPF0042 nucleotide-binding protein
MKLTIISGRSGSGKSVCLEVLEDLGFYCIDNLPVGLLPALIEQIHTYYSNVAVSIDARNVPTELNRFVQIIEQLKKNVTHYEIIYLDAEDGRLLQRFSETRRKHPLSSRDISLQEALNRESCLLEPIAQLADLRIDSSRLTVQKLRELIRERLSPKTHKGLSLLFESFGYKFGVPADSDCTFDVRCLPNPYWEPTLRNYTGLNEEVASFLYNYPLTRQLIADIRHFLEKWLPFFEVDNRSYMTVAIGCTGGQHRSVYIVEQLAHYFREYDRNVQVRHRELN